MTKTDPAAALTRAAANEADKLEALLVAAQHYVASPSNLTTEEIKAAAKAWTNAYHQRSRCEKHVRDAS